MAGGRSTAGLLARRLWAAPTSLLGVAAFALASLVWRLPPTRWYRGVLEIELPEPCPPDGCAARRFGRRARWLRRAPFEAITLGHVVLGVGPQALTRWRAHEWVHVRQAERWGPLFVPAYLASSVWQVLRGRDAWRDNAFERPAIARDRRGRTLT